MKRRHALCCGAALAAGLFGTLSLGRGLALGEGLRNPCLGPLPDDLRQHALVRSAFEGLDPSQLWDAHAHLLGIGDSGSGCSVHPAMQQWWHPGEVLRRKTILNGACVDANSVSIDRAYVQRLAILAADFPAGARWMLFAFDRACDDAGRERADWSSFHVPDAYAAAVSRAHPGRFEWVASIHPYRDDALERLAVAHRTGARAVKWLPSAMNIDLRDRLCQPFYSALNRLQLPLIVHCGEEKAAPGAHRNDLGNPLLVRSALAAGVTVIVAHAASLGQADDLDRRSAPSTPAFTLWARLMDEPAWRSHLRADLSAVFQANRDEAVWRRVLRTEAWHERLLHGSDHPLPGVMPLFAPARLATAGLLPHDAVEPLRRIRQHNPLLFDLVLKRSLRDGSARLSAAVFATRRHFDPAVATVTDRA